MSQNSQIKLHCTKLFALDKGLGAIHSPHTRDARYSCARAGRVTTRPFCKETTVFIEDKNRIYDFQIKKTVR